jgi:thioredoxin 2
MVAPEVRKVARETAGRLLVAKVNTEEVPSLGRRFRVSAIPTMTLFENGLEVARQAGRCRRSGSANLSNKQSNSLG